MHQCTQLYIFIHLLFMKFVYSITYLFLHFLFIWFLHCSLSLHSLSFIKIFYSRNQSSKPNCISFSGTDTSAVRYEQPVELFNVQRCLPILDNWIFDKVCWAFSRFPRALFPSHLVNECRSPVWNSKDTLKLRCVCARPVSCASVRAEETYSMAATAPERNRPDRTALLCPVRSATVLVCCWACPAAVHTRPCSTLPAAVSCCRCCLLCCCRCGCSCCLA